MGNNDTVFVIGSNSFSGSTFCKYLLEQGFKVAGFSRSAEPHNAFLPYKWTEKLENFTFHKCDVNKDLDVLFAEMDREKPGLVANFAAQSMVGQSWENPEDWFMTNAVSSATLFKRLKDIDYLNCYAHITTPEVYGSTDGFIKEDTPFNPSTPYAVSRAAGDMSLKAFGEAFEIPYIMTRAANVYGPGQQLYRIIPRTILYIMIGEKLQLHGGGHSQRSFIHMDDVSEATLKIMQQGTNTGTYHISTNEIMTIRELVERICQLMEVPFEDHVEVVGDRIGKDAAYMLDSEKLRTELDWADKVTLDQGLEECIKWVRDNLEDLKSQPFNYIHKP